MESQVTTHQDCSACGDDGFLIRGYETTADGGLFSSLVMDERTEGWIGIPHGGIGMGAIVELLSLAPFWPRNPAGLFPLSADFRMGGAQVLIGDTVSLRAHPKPGGGTGIIEKEGEPHPYITGEIIFQKDDPEGRALLSSYLPNRYADIARRLIPLPLLQELLRLRGRPEASGIEEEVQPCRGGKGEDRRLADRL